MIVVWVVDSGSFVDQSSSGCDLGYVARDQCFAPRDAVLENGRRVE